MQKVTLLCFISALSCAVGQSKYTAQHSSQSGYNAYSKEESNHYELNHYEHEHKPYPYRFGYNIKDKKGNVQYHKEEGDEYNVKKGSYGYTDAYGVYRHVDYIADHMGFRAKIRTNEPGTASYHPADVSIYAEQPPSHAYSDYSKSSQPGGYAEPIYAQPVHSAYDNEIQHEYDNPHEVKYVKPEYDDYETPSNEYHHQQEGQQELYPKLDQKYTYIPVYLPNSVEYEDNKSA